MCCDKGQGSRSSCGWGPNQDGGEERVEGDASPRFGCLDGDGRQSNYCRGVGRGVGTAERSSHG